MKKARKICQCSAVFLGQLTSPTVQPLLLDVEIAHRSKLVGQPAQLFPKWACVTGEDTREQGQSGSEAPGGHPHVMELFSVLSQPGPRLMGEHG